MLASHSSVQGRRNLVRSPTNTSPSFCRVRNVASSVNGAAHGPLAALSHGGRVATPLHVASAAAPAYGGPAVSGAGYATMGQPLAPAGVPPPLQEVRYEPSYQNTITLIGQLVAPPRRTREGGRAVMLSLFVPYKTKAGGSNFEVEVWDDEDGQRQLARQAELYLQVGMDVAVTGRMRAAAVPPPAVPAQVAPGQYGTAEQAQQTVPVIVASMLQVAVKDEIRKASLPPPGRGRAPGRSAGRSAASSDPSAPSADAAGGTEEGAAKKAREGRADQEARVWSMWQEGRMTLGQVVNAFLVTAPKYRTTDALSAIMRTVRRDPHRYALDWGRMAGELGFSKEPHEDNNYLSVLDMLDALDVLMIDMYQGAQNAPRSQDGLLKIKDLRSRLLAPPAPGSLASQEPYNAVIEQLRVVLSMHERNAGNSMEPTYLKLRFATAAADVDRVLRQHLPGSSAGGGEGGDAPEGPVSIALRQWEEELLPPE